MDVSETRYARSGRVNIAYQVVGNGPVDLVVIPPFVSNVELAWESPWLSEFLLGLAAFARVLVFDKRGVGLSDRVAGSPSLETRMDDARAVMDAAGCDRAVLVGAFEGGSMATLFAASYPERSVALVLMGSRPRYLSGPGYPWGPPRDKAERQIELLEATWGSKEQSRDAAERMGIRLDFDFGRYERLSASPGAAAALWRMNLEIDVRAVLPSVRVPTLVLYRPGAPEFEISGARYTAEHVPDSTLAAIGDPGDPTRWGPAEGLTSTIASFVDRVRGGTGSDQSDRVLATVLFTDIVDSTALASSLGDRAWRELLTEHHRVVRRELSRFRGQEHDDAGDGFFASFDGPARAVECARAIAEAVRGLGIDVRNGLHTGECERIGGKFGGIAVHIGARLAAEAAPGEVLVSSTVRDLVAGSGLEFEDRGAADLKGVPGEWRLYALRSG